MRSELYQFLLYAMTVVIGGACEEFLPKCVGVGVPILMALAVSVAARRSTIAFVLVALTAGAFEDALSSLPFLASACYFLVAAIVAHKTGFARAVLIFAYPLYQVWLKLVVPGVAGSLVGRIPMALALAALAALAVMPFLAWLERKAATDEP